MAEITRVNGGVGPIELIGRDLEWVHVAGIDCTGYADANGKLIPESNLEKVRRIIDGAASITIIGEPTATDVMFGVEGLGATAADLQAAIDAATGGTSTVAVVALTGAAFV